MKFQDVNSIVESFYKDYMLLSNYIEANFSTNNEFYKNFKQIVYPSMINYLYVSFEHHIKQLYLLIYNYLDRETDFIFDPKYFSLKDIPGHTKQDLIIKNNQLVLNMTENVISYTEKNMTAPIINSLFKRIGFSDISQNLDKMDKQEYTTIDFETNDTIQGRLKFFINHRNSCSHGFIDDFVSKNTIEEWIIFLKDIYNRIFASVIYKVFENENWDSFTVKSVYSGNILCFDNINNLDINQNSILCKKKNEEYYFYKIESINSNNETLNSTKNHVQIGLKIDSLFETSKVNENNTIYLVQ